MTFHFITLFPDAFSYLNESILARAVREKKLTFKFYNPRDFVIAKKKKTTKNDFPEYRRVDDKAYGGGPGMVMEALPIIKAVEKALANSKKKKNSKTKIIFLIPSGEQFDTTYAKNLVNKKYTDIVIICGRYEGVDARVLKVFKTDNISVGPFVLTGGELPAMIITDCMARQIGGVLGDITSLEETRVASPEVYTRPEILEYKNKKYRVPKVLLSGNHKLIEEWRENSKK
ncbi:MAG: tRNA (guanosine(37)-N1)-methyltransferase TrmD [Minisyncoccia bacterium]